MLLKDISTNIYTLKKLLLDSCAIKPELQHRSDSDFLEGSIAGGLHQKQIREHKIVNEFEVEDEKSLENLTEFNIENVFGNDLKQRDNKLEDQLRDKSKTNAERTCLMSLDITDSELQMLEQQAPEKISSDIICKSPEVLNEKENTLLISR